ncbi:MAG: hypothetical protein J4O03_06850 [Chloroflexi bacterium]|nr:hypothetical protein [Chloroflexota bacterium]MCI0793170.1 hypothetical protein [Chloroflexota bacterium]
MPRICTVCSHIDRRAIDNALIAGDSFRKVAARFDTSTGALQRHKGDHLPANLAKAHDANEVAHGDDLLDQVRSLQGKALAILTKAEAAGDLRGALGAIRETRGTLDLLAKLLGMMNNKPDPPGDQPPVRIHTIIYVSPWSEQEPPTVVEGSGQMVG